ncbi:MAG: biotin-dependent carboxyltransferase family protein [Pseudomonadales bacterium]|nr:biotin-dependent carboxyltransferase family protein [Pseudomonadales bacterium]
MIEILRCGSQCSIQDTGRFGYRHLGLAQAGVMDDQALLRANLLLGNEHNLAVLEFAHGPLELKFHTSIEFVLAGALGQAELLAGEAGQTLVQNLQLGFAYQAPAGSCLRLQQPLPPGMYGLLAVRGGFATPLMLGSRSFDSSSGIGSPEGRFLKRGDQLPVTPGSHRTSPRAGIRPLACSGELRAFPGPEHEQFSAAARAAFWSGSWQISTQCNRMGFRLNGIPLFRTRHDEFFSSAVIPGVVQVPADGQPILLGKDAQTTGGYPRIACVLEEELWQMANLGSGATVRFHRCDNQAASNLAGRYRRYRQRLQEGLQLACRA